MNIQDIKLVITGYGRHGKDTACQYLSDKYGLVFNSSSWFCAENVVFPIMKDEQGYRTPLECFEDRHAHRQRWYEIISEHNIPDKTRLAKGIFSANNIYCGLRSLEEFACAADEEVFDFSVWIDAGNRLPPEPKTSITITKEDCDFVIDNSGTLEEMYEQLDALISKVYLYSFYKKLKKVFRASCVKRWHTHPKVRDVDVVVGHSGRIAAYALALLGINYLSKYFLADVITHDLGEYFSGDFANPFKERISQEMFIEMEEAEIDGKKKLGLMPNHYVANEREIRLRKILDKLDATIFLEETGSEENPLIQKYRRRNQMLELLELIDNFKVIDREILNLIKKYIDKDISRNYK